jgi:hypothetical protein
LTIISKFEAFERRIDEIITEVNHTSPLAGTDLGKLPGWNWVTDEFGDYILCSPEVFDVLGVRAEKFIGKSIFSFQVTRQSYRKLNLMIRANKYEGEISVLFKTGSGIYKPIRMYVSQKKNEKGNNSGWYGFCHIISDDDGAQHAQQSLSSVRSPQGTSPSQTNSVNQISPLSQVLENARVFKNIVDRSRDLALINRVVSRLASSSLDFTECLHLVTFELGNILNVNQGLFMKFSPEKGSFLAVGGFFLEGNEKPWIGSEYPLNAMFEMLISSQVSIVITGSQTEFESDGFSQEMARQGIQKRALFPVVIDREIKALICLDMMTPDSDFQEKDIQLAEAILQQFSIIFQSTSNGGVD